MRTLTWFVVFEIDAFATRTFTMYRVPDVSDAYLLMVGTFVFLATYASFVFCVWRDIQDLRRG